MPTRSLTIGIFFVIFSIPLVIAHASISDGANAVDALGQYDDSLSDPQPVYTKSATNNGPNKLGFSFTGFSPEVLVDIYDHRFFVSDAGNNRVLVYTLNSDNTFPDRIPDYVLGQTNFYSGSTGNTQSGMNNPRGMVYDEINKKLYVAQAGNNRITIYDLSDGITNGENAVNVLGQINFTDSTSANTQNGLSAPTGLFLATSTNTLYVADGNGNRVKTFDVASITDGENATHVLGQTDFSGATANNTQNGLNGPTGVALDALHGRLFVAEFGGSRVKVFDVSDGITDNENAVNVLGQTTFSGASGANTQGGLNGPLSVSYDVAHNRLFVSEITGNRVKVFDVASITDGEDAVNVLGQSTFSGATAAFSQSGMSAGRGMTYDSGNQRLFVANGNGNRVTVYDVTAITDGENAVDVLGQYDDNLSDPAPVYTKGAIHDGPNKLGLDIAAAHSDIVIDTTNHRLFASDGDNNRVFVYNLTSGNLFIDRIPDYVIGQPNFATSTASVSQTGLSGPRGLAYDESGQRLFISNSNRITVYDLSGGITNGMNAVKVLGQTTFTGSSSGNSSSTLSTPLGLAYDSTGSKLFVAESGAHRVKIFDVASITDGEDAIAVLGQTTASGASLANTQGGMNTPQDVAYESDRKYLYVVQSGNHRVTVYDLSGTITNGMNAINVLGQTGFTGTSGANTQAGLNGPTGISYDEANDRLFVAQGSNNRVTVFDTATITDGEDAVNILGQSSYSASSAATTQGGLSVPRGIYYDGTSGRIFVPQQSKNRISIFDASVDSGGSTPSGGGGSAYGRSLQNIIFTTTLAPNPNQVISLPVATIIPNLPPPQITAPIQETPLTPAYQFTRDLSIGAFSEDVRELQIFLNSRGFIVTNLGNGSPGREIRNFGPATRKALAAFQKANKITPAVGYFGPLTRAIVNSMLSVR